MAKLSTETYKGVRDFYPQDQFIENYIFNIWRKTAESFGYEEYAASPLERTEIYTEKSGQEIINEQTFTFQDRGGRSVTLRPEMTPTLARMVAARRRELAFPLRWYSIPNIFRYEAPQRGRLREHYQLNVDIFGIADTAADIEIIALADKIMKNFDAKPESYEIRLNSYNQDERMLANVKLGLENAGINNLKFDPDLARGQAYYTGVVFEFFDTDPTNPRSILGGGRYDNLTALFGDTDLPVAGFGAGDVTIRDFLETHSLLPLYSASTKVYVAVLSSEFFEPASKLAEDLRNAGFNTAVDWSERKVGDQIRSANKLGVKFLVVVGSEEAESGTYKLKNLETGEEVAGTADLLILELNKLTGDK